MWITNRMVMGPSIETFRVSIENNLWEASTKKSVDPHYEYLIRRLHARNIKWSNWWKFAKHSHGSSLAEPRISSSWTWEQPVSFFIHPFQFSDIITLVFSIWVLGSSLVLHLLSNVKSHFSVPNQIGCSCYQRRLHLFPFADDQSTFLVTNITQ